MRKSILEELYYGNVSPCIDCHSTDDETTELISYLVAHHKTLSDGLTEKQKATAMINSLIDKYSYLEKSEHPSKMSEYADFEGVLQGLQHGDIVNLRCEDRGDAYVGGGVILICVQMADNDFRVVQSGRVKPLHKQSRLHLVE